MHRDVIQRCCTEMLYRNVVHVEDRTIQERYQCRMIQGQGQGQGKSCVKFKRDDEYISESKETLRFSSLRLISFIFDVSMDR